MRRTVFWLSLISHGPQSTRIDLQIQEGKHFLLNSEICHTWTEARDLVHLGLVLAALSVLGLFPDGANFCHSKEWCSPQSSLQCIATPIMYLVYPMMHSPWEADSHPASQKTPYLSLNLKSPFYSHKGPPLAPSCVGWIQCNPRTLFTSYINIIHP